MLERLVNTTISEGMLMAGGTFKGRYTFCIDCKHRRLKVVDILDPTKGSRYDWTNLLLHKTHVKGEKMKITQKDIEDLGLTKSKETYIEITVEADINDGDYISRTSRIDTLNEYNKVLEISGKLGNANHDWSNNSRFLSDKEINIFSEFVPYLDNEEVHTIESVSFTIVVDGIIYE